MHRLTLGGSPPEIQELFVVQDGALVIPLMSLQLSEATMGGRLTRIQL
jgi:hypothetical protein